MRSKEQGTDPGSAWFVYMVRTAAGALYTGISTDPARRLLEHQGSAKGARSLRGKGPLVLVWQIGVADRAVASMVEARIKRLSRMQKMALVEGLLKHDAIPGL